MDDKEIKVAFDIDGTLTDEMGFIEDDFRNAYKEKYHMDYAKSADYYVSPPENMFDAYIDDKKWLSEWKDGLWDRIMTSVPARKGMAKLTQDLHKKGVKIYIVTARYSGYEDCATVNASDPVEVKERKEREYQEQKEALCKKWLDKNGFYYDSFHFGMHEKENQLAAIGCDILVDDSPEQALNVSDKYKVFLVDAPYNQLIRGNNIYRCYPDDFLVDRFLANIEFMNTHAEVYLDNRDSVGDEIKCPFKVNGSDIYFPSKKGNIIFVIPAHVKNIDMETPSYELIQKYPDKVMVFRLSLLSDPTNVSPSENMEKSDQIVKDCIRKVTGKFAKEIKAAKKYKTITDLLMDKESTITYRFKCEVIKELLKYAESHRAKLFVIDGMESMMLDRGVVEKYADYRFIITSCNEKEIYTLKKNARRSEYSPFMFMEDITDVSTQIRKWRIISGMAPNELPHFINRQYSDADGVDCVHLLEGEKPYKPELLESILSEDTMVIADLHLSTKDPDKTERVIRGINTKCSPDDDLVIIGDMDGKKGTSSLDLIKKMLRQIRTKNVYFILGNNDQYTIDDYIDCGFKSIVDKAVLRRTGSNDVILTHCAYPVNDNEYNVHGHMHGSKSYWNMDWHNHFDTWDMNYFPIRIGDCIKIMDDNLYHGKSEIHRNY